MDFQRRNLKNILFGHKQGKKLKRKISLGAE
jgi:hypothetical protein